MRRIFSVFAYFLVSHRLTSSTPQKLSIISHRNCTPDELASRIVLSAVSSIAFGEKEIITLQRWICNFVFFSYEFREIFHSIWFQFSYSYFTSIWTATLIVIRNFPLVGWCMKRDNYWIEVIANWCDDSWWSRAAAARLGQQSFNKNLISYFMFLLSAKPSEVGWLNRVRMRGEKEQLSTVPDAVKEITSSVRCYYYCLCKKNFTFNNVLELFSSSMHFNVYDGFGPPSLIFHLSISLRLLARVFSLFPLPILHFRYDFYVHVDGSFESFQSLVGLSRSRMWVWMAQRTENEISASSLEAATSFHNAHTTSSSSKILCSFNEKTTQRENAAN